MLRQSGLILLALIASAAIPSSALAHARGGPGQACAGHPTVSALNQYCEDIPGATGGSTPAPGTPALGPSLRPSTVHKLQLGARTATSPERQQLSKALSKVLKLPAAGPRRPLTGSASAPIKTTGTAPWLWILVVLALVALTMLAAAAARRRHQAAT